MPESTGSLNPKLAVYSLLSIQGIVVIGIIAMVLSDKLQAESAIAFFAGLIAPSPITAGIVATRSNNDLTG